MVSIFFQRGGNRRYCSITNKFNAKLAAGQRKNQDLRQVSPLQNQSTLYLRCPSKAEGIYSTDTNPHGVTMRMVSSSVFAWVIMASASAISERAYAVALILVP